MNETEHLNLRATRIKLEQARERVRKHKDELERALSDERQLVNLVADMEEGRRPDLVPPDKYDAAYDRGYDDGLNDRPPSEPEDDTRINYDDGWRDGNFKRREEAGAFGAESA